MDNFVKKILIVVLIFFVQSMAYANSSATDLDQLLKNIRSMTADFNQTITDNTGKVIQKSRGNMALQQPGKFRWKTVSPNGQLVIATGQRLSIYDPDLEQVVIRGLSKQAGQTPALLLSDANPSLEKDFTVKTSPAGSSKLQWYVLTPKDKSSMFALIRMGFVGSQLSEMQLKDHLEHTTTIQFTNVKVNTKLAMALFYFAPPKNVDVIDETKR